MNTTPRAWTAVELSLLGKSHFIGASAEQSFPSTGSVSESSDIRRARKAELKLIGSAGDLEVARKLGRKPHAVAHKRRRLGIPAVVKPRVTWTEAELRLLGRKSDSDVAKETHHSL